MIYSGDAIRKLIKEGKLNIKPSPQIKEASIKIHFSKKLIIKPKEFVLAKSEEITQLSQNIAGLYDGYTHLARKGIITHLGSMFVDPGTNGQITFEIFNASDVEVTVLNGERAGQLILFQVIK
ncbi:hypothetical protein A2691_04065 [Candidatus Woesebacteria bacterium RIFCSPHIGHO2_01_FULL_39_23]|nr:MAG: hypothetical protein A2691_04065 [Candidatus Woesebacteria bacterium RIFCSPHIGHO2_01_FULL_39_23]